MYIPRGGVLVFCARSTQHMACKPGKEVDVRTGAWGEGGKFCARGALNYLFESSKLAKILAVIGEQRSVDAYIQGAPN